MGRPRYLIAKYVSDVFRNEPRNVGIILWADGVTYARFLGQRKNDSSIDGNKVKGFFRSLTSYKQWVQAWLKMLSKDELKIVGKTQRVSKFEPAFLDVIQASGRENYILDGGGEILEDVSSENISEVGNYLFSRLVQGPDEDGNDYQSPDEIRDDLLIEANIGFDKHVKADERIEVTLPTKKKSHHKYHIGIRNGKIICLAQVLPISFKSDYVKTNAEAMAFRFSLAETSPDVSPQCQKLVLLYPTVEESDENIQESMAALESADAKTINLRSERQRAIDIIHQLVDEARKHETEPE